MHLFFYSYKLVDVCSISLQCNSGLTGLKQNLSIILLEFTWSSSSIFCVNGNDLVSGTMAKLIAATIIIVPKMAKGTSGPDMPPRSTIKGAITVPT